MQTRHVTCGAAGRVFMFADGINALHQTGTKAIEITVIGVVHKVTIGNSLWQMC